MRKSTLLAVSLMALTLVPATAFAKHKHVQQNVDNCYQETQYFGWFRTTSRACLVDMLGEQYVRHMYGEGNHTHSAGSRRAF
jgi:hypothetical protein